MPLIGPNSDDIKKIHSEVNQIVNQRIVLTTLSVTVFGVMSAWVIPKTALPPGSEVEHFVYVVSILLTIMLSVLLLLNHLLSQMLRTFTTYLEVTSTSGWEQDWKYYRDHFSYIGYTRAQSIVFLLLGILAWSYPYLIAIAYPVNLNLVGTIVSGLVSLAYLILVVGIGWLKWGLGEESLRCRWKLLQNQNQ